MARPLRINIAGGWYHVTARGQRRDRIYLDARDRVEFLRRVEETTKRFRVEVHRGSGSGRNITLSAVVE